MVEIRQGVDDRDRRVRRKRLLIRLAKGSRDNRVNVLAEDPRYIGNGFALAQADLIRSEVDRVSAKLAHPNVKRRTCPKRGLLKNQRDRLSSKRPYAESVGLERVGSIEDRTRLLGCQIAKAQIIAAFHPRLLTTPLDVSGQLPPAASIAHHPTAPATVGG
jgi:hypothetical protein